jgi:hypothetical protein
MKCPRCVEEGRTSKVYSEGGRTTLRGYTPYYDEDGVYHSHNPNRITTSYRCSNDHKWRVCGRTSCPSCDFGRTPEAIIWCSWED